MVRTSFSQLRPPQTKVITASPPKEASRAKTMATMSNEKIYEVYGVDLRHQKKQEKSGRRLWTEELKRQVVRVVTCGKWKKQDVYEALGIYNAMVGTWMDTYPEEVGKDPHGRPTDSSNREPQLDTEEEVAADQALAGTPHLPQIRSIAPQAAAVKVAKRAYRKQQQHQQQQLFTVDHAESIVFTTHSIEQAIRTLEQIKPDNVSSVKITITLLED